MNYRLISALLKSHWAIDPQFALNSINWVNDLLSGKTEIEPASEEKYTPYATKPQASDRYVYRAIDEAEKGSVAVIPIMGSLMKQDQLCGPMGMATLGEMAKRADNNPNIEGILLHIDSPGGTVDGTERFASIVKNTQKPVVTYIDGLMASAALWIGSGADEIIASTANDEVGSVGVMMKFADFQPFYEEMGVKFHTVTADQSSEKMKMFEEIRNGNYKEFKEELLNPMAQTFINAIKENRPLAEDRHLSGKVFLADKAMGAFVDRIGSFDEAVNRVYELADENKTNNNNQNQATMKTDKVNEAIGVSALEFPDGYASLSLAQVEALENRLAQLEQDKEKADNDLTEKDNTISEKDKEIENLQNEVQELKESPGDKHSEVYKKIDQKGKEEEGKEEMLTDDDLKTYNAIKR
ncbi:MAG: S49 family peptidase [Bacteroidales bacterium]